MLYLLSFARDLTPAISLLLHTAHTPVTESQTDASHLSLLFVGPRVPSELRESAVRRRLQRAGLIAIADSGLCVPPSRARHALHAPQRRPAASIMGAHTHTHTHTYTLRTHARASHSRAQPHL